MEACDRPELFGCPFDRLTMGAAVERCVAWCLGPRVAHTVITANAATVCLMRRDPNLREACRNGDLVLPDGMSVVWTSRVAGLPVPERVSGADLMVRLLEAASAHRLSVYLLGARSEVVAELARRCAREYPGLAVAGFRDGYFGPEQDAAVVEHIRQAAPHMLFVGMPSPFKETWCERNRQALDVPVIMGVGGTFDVLAGYIRRAPGLMQSLGLEWSWRLAMEPRRMWKRYLLGNFEYLWLAAGAVLRRRAGLARHAE
jgi:N-acetylglucosaminyldiphosphoundecaprenol N-acetyl-beta-D-mannosaminyltransferase